MNKIILIADDEKEIAELLQLYLEKDNYRVLMADNGLTAFQIAENQQIDLAIVDIMMPQMDGFQLLKKIRDKSNIPIIILSAKISDSDKILGLDLGADDYITKPFNPLEVVARVNANLRRADNLSPKYKEYEHLKVRDLELDLEQCILLKDAEKIELTAVEFRLMKLFMGQPGRVFTKQQLFEAGWDELSYVDDNSIMVCISKLRTKLDDDNTNYIKTIRGLGYRLEK